MDKNIGEQRRQGDIFPIKIAKLPRCLKKKGNNVLVHSDSTMHDHTLVKEREYYLRVSSKLVADDELYTLADEGLASTFQMRAREYNPIQEA